MLFPVPLGASHLRHVDPLAEPVQEVILRPFAPGVVEVRHPHRREVPERGGANGNLAIAGLIGGLAMTYIVGRKMDGLAGLAASAWAL